MSSSMRNALQRRNHKERSQPYERSKWGLLEKRKDYQLRSRDFNAKKVKKAQLAALARERNPDEFYFKMTSSRTRDGGIRVAERPGSEALSNDAVKLLKTQDAGYVRLQEEMERKKIEDLEERLAFVDSAGRKKKKNKHIIFFDNEEEERNFDPAKYFDTHPDLVDRVYNRPRLAQLAEGGFGEELEGKGEDEADAEIRRRQETRERSKMAKGREQLYKELEARYKRREELRKVDRELELQRARMGKGGTSAPNKWATVRKR
ncbi:U3 small nucleolar RNA-associated protein 11 [Wilcoxina mikolae CBS 423.85]|nr:U3 small nucleolar RNA-associated protein 11 [Wilcoxina mikolae CBS 423.85]